MGIWVKKAVVESVGSAEWENRPSKERKRHKKRSRSRRDFLGQRVACLGKAEIKRQETRMKSISGGSSVRP